MKIGRKSVGHPIDVATGVVYSDYEDITIPGKVNLTWGRYYSTALLDNPPSPLGPGWTNRYFSTLTHEDDKFLFVTSEGDLEVFDNADGTIETGGIIRNLGSFMELNKRGDRYVVTQWDIESGDVECFVFKEGPKGNVMPLACIEDVTGQGLDLMRDDAGKLISIMQRREQRTLVIDYNHSNHVSSVSFLLPENKKQVMARYEYNEKGCLTAAYDALGYVDYYEYNEKSLITREIVKDGGVFFFKYDNRGRCVHTSGLDRYDEKTIRYLDCGWTEVTDSLGLIARFQYLPSGQVITEVDPAGASWKTEYDEHGRVIARVDPNGAKTTHEYDEFSNRTKTTKPGGRVQETEYNQKHVLVSLKNSLGRVWKRDLDNNNLLVALTDPMGNNWQFAHNTSGMVSRITNPKGASITFEYARNGDLIRETDWNGNTYTHECDSMGRIVRQTDSRESEYRFTYDFLDNPTEVRLPDSSAVRCSYDAAGNLVEVKERNDGEWKYDFGPCKRLLRIQDPLGNEIKLDWGTEPRQLLGLTNAKGERFEYVYGPNGKIAHKKTFDGRVLKYEYDMAGNCTAVVNNTGERTTFEYNENNELLKRIAPDNPSAEFTFDAVGNLQSAKNEAIDLRFERDAFGRVVKEIQGDHVLEYEFDPLGNLVLMRTSNGFENRMDFDARGKLTSLVTNQGHSISFAHDRFGNEIERLLPGGLTLSRSYDLMDQLISQRVYNSRDLIPASGKDPRHDGSIPLTECIAGRNYRYDRAGNLAEVVDRSLGTTSYTYDKLQQLVSAISGDLREAFSFDNAGNMTAVTTDFKGSQHAEELTYAKGNRLVAQGDVQYEYDGNGRIIRKRGKAADDTIKEWSYEWSSANELVSLTCPDGTRWEYAYDPFGRRVSKKCRDQNIHFVWCGDVVVQELNNGSVKRTFLYEPCSFVPMAQLEGGAFYSVVTDHLGTPKELIDTSQTVVWRNTDTSWGKASGRPKTAVECPLRFQGQWHDDESGLHYNRFRYYNPESGRYISPDPIGIKGGPNEYRYVGSPTMGVDPHGLTAAPADLPNEPGVYIITSGNDAYVGSAGMGEQGMNQRVSGSGHHPSQELLARDDVTVQYRKVNLGKAETTTDRNNILRNYERQEYERMRKGGYDMLNDDKGASYIQADDKVKPARELRKKHKARANPIRTCQ